MLSFQEELTIWVNVKIKGVFFGGNSARMNVLYGICLSPVAINLIVQHIQDILNGDICKWQRGSLNGRTLKRVSEQGDLHHGASNSSGKRVLLEPSCRPH